MRILFSAPENAWGGIFYAIRAALPGHHLEATGCFAIGGIEGYDVLIPTTCRVTGKLLEQGDRLKLVQQCGAGIEMIDVQAAREHNVWVANVPTHISGSADSVAELGIFLMLGLARDWRGMAGNLAEQTMGEPVGRTLSGSTVGLVGLGGIGRALAKRLRAFDVRLLALKRSHRMEAMRELELEWVGGPEDLVKMVGSCDYVVLCLPLTPETNLLMNRETLSAMRPNSFLINLSRGGLVDRDALYDALASGRIAGAGLDVFWKEPPDPNDPIFGFNVLSTPHVGGFTDLSVRKTAEVVVENILRVERNEKPLYCAN